MEERRSHLETLFGPAKFDKVPSIKLDVGVADYLDPLKNEHFKRYADEICPGIDPLIVLQVWKNMGVFENHQLPFEQRWWLPWQPLKQEEMHQFVNQMAGDPISSYVSGSRPVNPVAMALLRAYMKRWLETPELTKQEETLMTRHKAVGMYDHILAKMTERAAEIGPSWSLTTPPTELHVSEVAKRIKLYDFFDRTIPYYVRCNTETDTPSAAT